MSVSGVAERRETYALQSAVEPAFDASFDLLVTAPQGVAKLRELILSLAFSGKLCRQKLSDDGAETLLAQIRAQKNRAIAEGLIKAKKRQKPFTEGAVPCYIPATWRWAPLEHVALQITDGSHNPPQDSGFGYPMLSSQNVLEGEIDFTNPSRYLSDADFEIENKRTQVKPGDVLLTIVASLGRSSVVPAGAPKFAMQRSVAKIRSPMNAAYLSLFFRSPLARTYYDEHGKGTAQKGIYLGKLAEMPIPVAPLIEQTRIVARVEELMQLCDALEAHGRLQDEQHARLVATLFDALAASASADELAANWQRIATHFDLLLDRSEAVDALEQTLLQLAVRGLLVPQDPIDEPASKLLDRIRAEKNRLITEGKVKRTKFLPPVRDEEKPFELPVRWEWVRVGSIGVTQTGGTPASNKSEYFDGKFPFIGPGQITSNGEILSPEKCISELGRSQSSVAEPGDILMVCIGGSIGKCAVASFATAFNQQINSIHPLLVSNEFIFTAMTANNFVSAVVSKATGSATPIISKGKWDMLLLPIPPLVEQHRIVARVEQLRHLCADLRERLQQSRVTQSRLADALVAQAGQ